jgi:hypothetical protein
MGDAVSVLRHVGLRLSATELELVRSAAAAEGLPVSGYIRRLVRIAVGLPAADPTVRSRSRNGVRQPRRR